MHGQLTVEPADLRGWADQVERAGGDCGYLQAYVATFVPDGDFGWLARLIETDYERVVAALRDNLAVAAQRLDITAGTIHEVAHSYERADAMAVHGLGRRGGADDGQGVSRFLDVAVTRPSAPGCQVVPLPTVSLGEVDLVLGVVDKLGGPDVRRELTELIAGDLDKVMRQAQAWEHAGAALDGVGANLAHGSARCSRTWLGVAASAAQAYVATWTRALASQRQVMVSLGEHLRDLVTQTVDVAQMIFELVRLAVSIVVAGWTSTCIPIFGPFRTARNFRALCVVLYDVKKVWAIFHAFLAEMKAALALLVDGVRSEPLPSAPTPPGLAR